MAAADVVVVGAGPSGLAAALEAANHGAAVVLVEPLDGVGGLSRTVVAGECRFDIGPHRFFTQNDEVRRLFRDTLGSDAIRVDRTTRILYDGRYFDYPLTVGNAIGGTGLGEAVAFGASYLRARVAALAARGVAPRDFAAWVVRQFGRRLYESFFRVYTEKVWGVPCTLISAEWAGQRIRGLSLAAAVRHAVAGARRGGPRSFEQVFDYPRLGAGQVYEAMAAAVVGRGATLATGTRARRVLVEGARVRAIEVAGAAGTALVEGRSFLCSAPLADLVAMVDPPPPVQVRDAARALRHRDHVAVNLVADGLPFHDQWVYVHDRRVRAARVANYRNFSAAMTGGRDVSPLTVEYFAFPGDDIDRLADAELIGLAGSELERLGLVRECRPGEGFVVRSRGAYPLLELGHERHVAVIRDWLAGFDNLLPIGRAGMFKYNNQDHAMMTGLLAARTLLGIGRFDPWAVNIDASYHERGSVR